MKVISTLKEKSIHNGFGGEGSGQAKAVQAGGPCRLYENFPKNGKPSDGL